MSAHAQILEWSKGQPLWRQDALRRLLIGPFGPDDEAQVLELLKSESKLIDTQLKPAPLLPEHIPAQGAGGGPLTLVALSNVFHANRLAQGQRLAFGTTGLTLVYGENGTGKTGYARILKRACRARSVEPIQGDVFDNGPKKPATATFEIVAPNTGATQMIPWEDGKSGPADLARIGVFDSKCAAVYVDGDNQVTFIPYNLDCFERLGRLCDRLKDRVSSEQTALKATTAAPVLALAPGTTSYAFLAGLATKTDAELNAATAWTPEHDRRLKELSGLVTDPEKRALSIRQLHSQLKGIRQSIVAAAPHLTAGAIQALKDRKAAMNAARQAADLAAEKAFANEPLPGVGSSPWRLLYDAARSYSEQMAYNGKKFPVIDDGSRCVFCHQPLEAEARERLRRFDAFIVGETTTAAATASAAWDAAVIAFKAATGSLAAVPTALDNLLKLENEPMRDAVAAYIAGAMKLRAHIEVAVIEDIAQTPVEPPEECLTGLDAFLSKLEKDAATAEAAVKDEAAIKLRNELAELQARKLLHDNKAQVEKRLTDLGTLAKLGEAIKACGTTGISQKGTELIKQYVTGNFETALKNERKALGIGAIPLRLISSSAKGSPKHQLKLDQTTFAGNTSLILSEGEHRAVGLASFLAEQNMIPGSAPIIIDDPVSSLDHVRRHYVAQRLMEEATKRQVIVFTHDLLFYTDVSTIAAERQIPLTKVAIQRGAKGYGTIDPDGDPWVAKILPRRRAWLDQQYAKLKKLYDAGGGEEYEKEARYFYDRMRETWERLIEEGLFANVVVRYRRAVQTQRLSEAVLDDVFVARVYNGMTAISEYTAHDKPTAAGTTWPDPDTMKKHLDDLSACIAGIEAESKAVAKRRKSLEKAPAAAPAPKPAPSA